MMSEGGFTGQIIPHNYFFYEPEGIVVWECEADSSGYYLMVDQGKINNTFQVFDRKTLEYIGGFGGEITLNTDGIAITQKAFGDFRYMEPFTRCITMGASQQYHGKILQKPLI
jgi:3-phytase